MNSFICKTFLFYNQRLHATLQWWSELRQKTSCCLVWRKSEIIRSSVKLFLYWVYDIVWHRSDYQLFKHFLECNQASTTVALRSKLNFKKESKHYFFYEMKLLKYDFEILKQNIWKVYFGREHLKSILRPRPSTFENWLHSKSLTFL